MNLDLTTGLVDKARQLASPNCDDRPAGTEIDLVVIHGISLPPCEFGGPWIDALFTNGLDPNNHPYFQDIHQLKVSSHLLIRRDGELVQYVPLHRRAWHAGKSEFCGRERCNDYSIGVELEGCDHQSYSDDQYAVLDKLLKLLIRSYPELAPERIAGHSDVAPGRKTDPGEHFDWARMYANLGAVGPGIRGA